MDWDKWGLFISLVTPLILGIGALANDVITKWRNKNKAQEPKVLHGLPVDYETDYIKLLRQNLRDARQEIKELKAKLRKQEENND